MAASTVVTAKTTGGKNGHEKQPDYENQIFLNIRKVELHIHTR